MQQFVRLGGLLVLGLALIVPSFAGEEKKGDKKVLKGTVIGADPEKKDDKKDPKGKEDPPKEKLVYGVHFTGKLTQMEPNSQKDFTVQVTSKVAELNQGAAQQIQSLQNQMIQQQQAYARATNLQGRQNAINAMRSLQTQALQAQRDLYKYKDVSKDFKLRAGETVKVRCYYPPLDYDEKGNVKKYTKEELKTLRGTSGLPGYNAEYDSLRTGQIVHVYLAKPPAPVKGGGQKGKKIDELDDEASIQARPEVVMIMIISEPPMK